TSWWWNRSKDHQVTATDVGVVEPTQYLKAPIGKYLAQILGGQKGAGMDIGQIDDVDAPGFARGLDVQGILGIPGEYFHPGGTLKDAFPLGIGLGQKFGHSVLGMYP